MKVLTKEILQAMNNLAKIIPRRPSYADIGLVRLVSDGNILSMSGTDGDSVLTCTISCDGKFSGYLPASTLISFLRKSRRCTQTQFTSKDNSITVGTETGEVSFDKDDTAIFGLGRDVDWDEPIEMNSSGLCESFSYALMAASQDFARPHICCVCMHEDGKIIATDGHRMHVCDSDWKGNTIIIPLNVSKIIPRIFSKTDLVSVQTGGQDRVKMVGANWVVNAKVVDSEFPPYLRVIPNTSEFIMRFETGHLFNVAGSINLKKFTQSRLTVNGSMSISVQSEGDCHCASTANPESNSHVGDDFVCGINLCFLVDALKNNSRTTEVSFDGPLDPIRLTNDIGQLAVVMPCRA